MNTQTPSVERSTRASQAGLVLALLVLLAATSAPWWAERSSQRLMTEILYTLALAQMWNLLAGYGGLLSVGQQGFVGLGGYCLVVLGLQFGLNPFLIVPLAGVVTALVAIPTAAVLFRLRGAYFAVGTWVVAEVFRLIVANTASVGGGSGTSITQTVTGIPAWWRESTTLWLAIALGGGATLAVYWLLRSRHGLALTAVRDSEHAAESLGVSVARMKWFVYIAAAAGCGMVGALIFITKLRIAPEAAFSMDWTAAMFFVVIIGGIGTIEGPIVGTLIYFVLRQFLSDYGSWYMIVLGCVAVAFMLWIPRGVWGLMSSRFDLHFFAVQRRVRFASTQEKQP
ncbi:MAG: branched-chain amino acid ABC transporter permease [Rhodoferax sp.]|uniref:branched-chain amino acid ABC transporter permease n=1 Tax=Rhodoferax sp. TaxID=50421 RepID=UPI002728BFAB|nr:branched-chain amino acid ABC transporter permease [Rhodoferax sp.]MDO8449987.1 branched-chain amino acid ABC transporter permease [Rhodoferax sp.]